MLIKRKGSPHWQIKFALSGRTINRSSRTTDRKLAEKIETKARNEVLEQTLAGIKPSISWSDARDKWLQAKATKRSIETDKYLFASIDKFFEGEPLSGITTEAVEGYAHLVAARASPATANRHIDLIRAVFLYLKRKRVIDTVPQFDRFPVEAKEPVWATQDDFNRLVSYLPPHARHIATFAVLTGLRKSNVTMLKWETIDLDRCIAFVPAARAKGKKTIPIPLSPDAVALLRSQIGNNLEYVFVDHKGRAPCKDIKTCWETARRAAGMEHFRFHDLRHTFASWHLQNGTPESVLQELGGWASNVMVKRYAHLSLDHLAKYAGNSAIK